ncbi:D-alanyl-D-alanine carboxypeptidase/D-alanyl-D-alanine-endopeptidase [soil metagenome]
MQISGRLEIYQCLRKTSSIPIIIILTALCFSSCRVQRTSNREQPDYKSLIENSLVFNQYFMGFSLYDPENDSTLYAYNAEKYFVPASNTKLFTFYTSLRILGDSVPSLRYSIRNDSLIFKGTGDPSFLYPEFQRHSTYEFLKNRPEKLFYTVPVYVEQPYGPGWSWDDFRFTYSSEKAPFPIYGNYIQFIFKPLQLTPVVKPSFFKDYLSENPLAEIRAGAVQREFTGNIFTFRSRIDTREDTVKVPFKYSDELFVKLLSDTLHQEVTWLPSFEGQFDKIFFGFPTDSLYKQLMWESDNFIAEQLLLLCSSILFDSLNSKRAIRYAQENYFSAIIDKPKWVDGSGLSRYNLFTPRSMVQILNELYMLIPEDKLFYLLPAGGTSGTLKEWYKSSIPYIFAKTGSMSNVHCLSGFIITSSGKRLIFSFMHNNFTTSSSVVKYEMEKVLRQIHQQF